MKTKIVKKRCYNCKHRTDGFKIGNLTHYHCKAPSFMEKHKTHDVSAWDTLVVFSDSCDEHEFRENKK